MACLSLFAIGLPLMFLLRMHKTPQKRLAFWVIFLAAYLLLVLAGPSLG